MVAACERAQAWQGCATSARTSELTMQGVDIAGITVQPDESWMQQMARNVTMEECGVLRDCRYLLHDRVTKYSQSFRAIIASGQVEPLVHLECVQCH